MSQSSENSLIDTVAKTPSALADLGEAVIERAHALALQSLDEADSETYANMLRDEKSPEAIAAFLETAIRDYNQIRQDAVDQVMTEYEEARVKAEKTELPSLESFWTAYENGDIESAKKELVALVRKIKATAVDRNDQLAQLEALRLQLEIKLQDTYADSLEGLTAEIADVQKTTDQLREADKDQEYRV